MNKYTVVFRHLLPIGKGVAATHCSWELANSPKEAADSCILGLGGYGNVIVVLEGHQQMLLQGENIFCWDNQESYNTRQLEIQKYSSPHETRATEPLKRTTTRSRKSTSRSKGR